jgi:rfaE bifunctional protein nucleotidyltransferase chain/domain
MAKKTVLVGGCFDLIHYGHVSFLTAAKATGDYLVVALESDENVRRMKGPTRPIHTQEQRKLMLESLKVVNEVIALPPMHGDEDYKKLVHDVRPSVIAVTEGDAIEQKKRLHAESVGAVVTVIPKIHTPSTSQLAKLLELE